jgi:hypothetical protein
MFLSSGSFLTSVKLRLRAIYEGNIYITVVFGACLFAELVINHAIVWSSIVPLWIPKPGGTTGFCVGQDGKKPHHIPLSVSSLWSDPFLSNCRSDDFHLSWLVMFRFCCWIRSKSMAAVIDSMLSLNPTRSLKCRLAMITGLTIYRIQQISREYGYRSKMLKNFQRHGLIAFLAITLVQITNSIFILQPVESLQAFFNITSRLSYF